MVLILVNLIRWIGNNGERLGSLAEWTLNPRFLLHDSRVSHVFFRRLSGPPVPSPDGTKIAFTAFTQGKSGTAGLWLRSLDSAEARFLTGTEGAMYPFWSPDGKFLAFFAGGKLKKLDLSGGSAIPVYDVLEGRGGALVHGGCHPVW